MRHEATYVAVRTPHGGPNLGFCPQYPTKMNKVLLGQCSCTHEGGSRTVRERSDDQHRGGQELGLDGMVNIRKPLLNVVNVDKPKMLQGLTVVGSGAVASSDADTPDHRRKGGTSPIRVRRRNVVSPISSQQWVSASQDTLRG